ncbi:MAG: hypothetical protein M3464_21990 [Chloroflexota bacterium]|nr:hypothetical protein [Chloroflexota bacterium]
MAVGLGLLGRGRARAVIPYWVLHVAGAAAAGATVGGVAGLIGEVLGLAAWRPWVILAAGSVALIYGLRKTPPRIGRQRQVPRRWSATTPLAWIYLVWGMMLGSGLATPVFQTAFLLLLGAQLTAGWQLSFFSGALFGAFRQMTALGPVLRRLDPGRTMHLLEVLRPYARRGNIGLIVGGGVTLVLVSVLAG